jgi:uncharacterized protein YijF (DUF1287 family)
MNMKRVLCSLALICSRPDAAIAQWSFDPNFAPSINYPVVNNPCPNGSCGTRNVRSTPPLKLDLQRVIRAQAEMPKDTAVLAFTPSTSRRRANLASFVDRTRAADPVGADKMQQLFASTDIIGSIDGKMRSTYGMRANNVADAYAVWWVSAWMGARGRSDDATPGQMAMVRRQAASALASTPEFVGAGDADKQQMAEAMLVQAALIGDTIDTYKADPAMLARARAAIAKGARGSGLDLDTMTLTDEGFVPAGRKTGAADRDPGAPEQLSKQALGRNDTAAPPYLLLAAAGGAGLGGTLLLGKMIGRRG